MTSNQEEPVTDPTEGDPETDRGPRPSDPAEGPETDAEPTTDSNLGDPGTQDDLSDGRPPSPEQEPGAVVTGPGVGELPGTEGAADEPAP